MKNHNPLGHPIPLHKLLDDPNCKTGEIFYVEKERYDAAIFLNLLKKILDHYPTGRVAMVLDNARIHYTRRNQPFLEEHRARLELVFLPPYSLQLNLVEAVWKWLKESIIHSIFLGSVQKIVQAVQSFFQEVNQLKEEKEEVVNRIRVRM